VEVVGAGDAPNCNDLLPSQDGLLAGGGPKVFFEGDVDTLALGAGVLVEPDIEVAWLLATTAVVAVEEEAT